MLIQLFILLLQLQTAFAYDAELTPDEIAGLAPKNQLLAAAFFILLFAVKSLIFVIPIPLLYISVGLIFDPAAAFVVNVIGMIVCTAVPYWIGRFSGAGFFQKLIKKYPKIQILDTFQHDNQWFFSFMVRVVGFLPCDAVSAILGALKVGFWKYISGTVVGMMPGLIATTMVGITITNPQSPAFIFSCILTVLVSAGSVLVWRIYRKIHNTYSPQSAFSAGLDPQHEQKQENKVDDLQQ
ncbi:MAG TPA: TVP38/TMEM64 family protein [Clostridiales bacterium]|nr:TVP38/TMEM64 family protein [Clostridiales bacterium]